MFDCVAHHFAMAQSNPMFGDGGREVGAPDWHTDWLYALVLREIERVWTEWCDHRPKAPVSRYVLVEEYTDAQGARCRGDIARVWVRDADGFREVALAEHERLTADLGEHPSFPFILVEFHITNDRQRVALGLRTGMLGGQGFRYLVQGTGAEATLEFDPTGGFWRS